MFNTVGERVRLRLELKLRLLWRKNKNRIKADHYTKHDSPDEAKNHPPPPRVWGDRTQDEWNELVDWIKDSDYLRQQEQEKELYRKQAEEAQQRAYLASLKTDQADQRANWRTQNNESNYGALDLAREKNNECSSGEKEEEEGEQQSSDDYSLEEEE
ncbi:hypothetical protein Tco_0941409 [Tanacetum coccineum]|uniref:Uncharacterized protein n=1 Tax=Tanacetum coccineum TaxID=301880 RepID=A0ABQ5DXG6_9ASTR